MATPTLQPIPHPPVDEALIQEITRKIVAAFNPRRIILFGSRARDDAQAHSDVDLFIEMETNLHPVERRTQIRRLFQPQKCAMDILVYTPQEVAERRDVIGTMVYTIERKGRKLYERSEA